MFFYSKELKNVCRYISKKLNVNSYVVKTLKFNDGEFKIRIKENIFNKDIFLFKNIYKPINETILETFFIIKYLKENFARSVFLVSPYIGYSRQDKPNFEFDSFVPFKSVLNLFELSGVNAIFTVDLHSGYTKSFCNFPLINISTSNLISKIIKEKKYTALFPDNGSYNRFISKKIKKSITLFKKREGSKVKITSPLLKNKSNFLFIDDIIDSGKTLLKTIKVLKSKLSVYVTHGIFLQNNKTILKNSKISKFYISNSVFNKHENLKKTKLFDISSLILEEIRSFVNEKNIFKN
ncbi:ribose-phosphate diphosphokinase [Candidatus Vidania fulgoroideorum]